MIRKKISQPYQILRPRRFRSAPVSGLSSLTGESRTDYLHKCADPASMKRKRVAPVTSRFSVPGGWLQRQQENKSFEDDLMQALERGEFRVYYQPIADAMNGGNLRRYEALVRYELSSATRR